MSSSTAVRLLGGLLAAALACQVSASPSEALVIVSNVGGGGDFEGWARFERHQCLWDALTGSVSCTGWQAYDGPAADDPWTRQDVHLDISCFLLCVGTLDLSPSRGMLFLGTATTSGDRIDIRGMSLLRMGQLLYRERVVVNPTTGEFYYAGGPAYQAPCNIHPPVTTYCESFRGTYELAGTLTSGSFHASGI